MGVTATKDSTFEWREIGGQVTRPQFIVFVASNQFGITMASIAASYGKPLKIYEIENFIVAEMVEP
jgi:hypothetical protein